MSLLDRLIGTEEPKLPVHQFMAAMAEYKRGSVTGAQVISGFGLSGAEATNLQDFLTNLDTDVINRQKIHDVLMLAEAGFYPKAKVKTELGLTQG